GCSRKIFCSSLQNKKVRKQGAHFRSLLVSAIFTDTTAHPILAVSNEAEYRQIIEALRAFDRWCRLVSTTDIGLSNRQIQEICCRGPHLPSQSCCQTAILGKRLEELGGFGSSSLVHVMMMHLGPFV